MGRATRTRLASEVPLESNVSNDAVDDRFFENHAYHALTPEQKNTLRLKRLKRGNVGNGHGGSGNGNGKGKGK
jgi:hypothetical protein